jgi:deazaflavin-dependent oxidoreductase (nitroreductase family)
MDWNQKVIEEFRANKGVVQGQFEGMTILLLTNKGAKSGKEYVIPLAYTMDGDKYVIAASKGGAPTNPDWYHNLKANPEVTVEVRDQKFTAKATEIEGSERDEFYNKHAETYPGFKEYEKSTTRTIPIFTLEKI